MKLASLEGTDCPTPHLAATATARRPPTTGGAVGGARKQMSPATDHGESAVALAATDRLSREALVCVDWLVGEPENPLGPDPYPSYQAALDAHVADALAAIEQKTGRLVRLRETDAGWGASFAGVAVELLEPMALLGDAAAAVREAARTVAWGYRRIAQAMGRRPLISLGTAECLAMDDLLDRSALAGVLVSGDINISSPDRLFTSGDAFFVVLATEAELHHYQVSAHGEVFYAGASPLPPNHCDDLPPYLEDEQASHQTASRADRETPPAVVLSRGRRVWAWLLGADEWLSKWAKQLWRWVIRYVFRTIRAFWAGSGAIGLFIVALLLVAGVDTIPTMWVLGVLLAGGALGMAARRYSKRLAWLTKFEGWLGGAAERISGGG